MDDFVESLQTDRKSAIWFAEMSDGSTIYMDDGRPGAEPHSAWIRLGILVRRNGLSIKRLGLRFRSNILSDILPSDAEGYYFRRAALGQLTDTETLEFMLVGSLTGELVSIQKWKVPELVLMETESRPANDQDPSLIRNPK